MAATITLMLIKVHTSLSLLMLFTGYPVKPPVKTAFIAHVGKRVKREICEIN